MTAIETFRALGDPTRAGIVEELGRRPRSVSELAEGRGMTLTGVLKHVKVLEAAGLVRRTKFGRVVTLDLEPGGLQEAERWLSDRQAFWSGALDRLAELVEESPSATSPRDPHDQEQP